MENGMTLKQIADTAAREDPRSVAYLYHAAIVAVRALDIYGRGRQYTEAEARRIRDTMDILYPRRLRGICR